MDPTDEGATRALEARLPTARGGASAAVLGDRLAVWVPGGAGVIAFGATDVFERLVAP